MSEYCTVCGMYEDKRNFKVLSCGCSFCKFSVGEWVIAQLDSFYKENFALTCPQGALGHVLSEADLQECLKPEQFAQYDTARLRKNLLRDPAFRQCPMNQCNYIGWVDSSQKCKENLTCEKCKGSWMEPSLLPLFSRLRRNGESLIQGTNDFWSTLWKEIWVKFCPKCDSPIEKTGGCYHMTCQSCSYEFCWDCLQPYRSHKLSLCQVSVGYTWGLVIFMLTGVFARISSISDVFFFILSFVLAKVLIFFAGVALLWLYIGTTCMCYDYKRGYYYGNGKKIVIFVLLLLCIASLAIMAYFFSFFIQVIELASIIGICFGVNFGSCLLLFKR